MKTSIKNAGSILISIFFMSLILISCNKSDDVTDSSNTTQNNPPLSYFSIFPDTIVVLVGDGLYLTITAVDTNGMEVTNIVPTFSSSDENVFTVLADGRIDAKGIGQAILTANASGKTAKTFIYVGAASYDLATGIPKICNANYIDLSKIGRISRFRSTVGHSYTDGDSTETCRSMKHYFEPKSSVDWTSVDIFAPTTGTIMDLRPDGIAGYQIRIRPRDVPAFDISLFHVNPDSGIIARKWVNAGEHIGKHASSYTTSDIAVSNGGKETGTLISYFEVITNDVFSFYQARGVSSRQAAIITKEERDADPVPCVGEEQFTMHGTIPDWLVLN